MPASSFPTSSQSSAQTPAQSSATSPQSSLQEALLAGLTKPQRDAVTHVDGPLLILAGPGSGKTRVITSRVAYLVRCCGIPPWNILAITFTNKAAGEMNERVASLLTEKQAQAVTVCTFHSLCARILRIFGDKLNLPPGYSIYDTSDQQRAMKQVLSDMQIDKSNFPPSRVLGTISSAKNELMGAKQFAVAANDFYSRSVSKIYTSYQRLLTKNNALDFDDLLLKTVELLRNHPDVRQQLRDRYQYLMIDEYQDTNHAQFVIANTLATPQPGEPDYKVPGAADTERDTQANQTEQLGDKPNEREGEFADVDVDLDSVYDMDFAALDEANEPGDADRTGSGEMADLVEEFPGGGGRNICVTGDPDQSIYRWRGADIRNILEFEEHYPDSAVVRLEQNYRSTKRILAAADGLIQNNKRRKHKTLWTENDEGDNVRVVTHGDEYAEARWIADEFRQMHDHRGIDWRDMAVFYRINSLSRVMEEALREAAVPYQIARGTAFYDRKEIKDAVAFLRVIANPTDEVNLLRVINTPARGISQNTVKALQAFAVANQIPVFDLLSRADQVPSLNVRAAKACQKFAAMLSNWRQLAEYGDGEADESAAHGEGHETRVDESVLVVDESADASSFRAFVDQILRDSGLHEYYSNDKSDPDQERLANLGELVSSAQQFENDYTGADVLQFDEKGNADPALALANAPLSVKLEAYLQQVSLVSDVDSVNASDGSVTLMTLHAAKGLEYPVVVLVAVEDGLLPHSRAHSDEGELEEERRLCFVGITRAERDLVLSNARRRTVFGRTEPTIPSRFIDELPSELVDRVDEGANDFASGVDTFYAGGSELDCEFEKGDTVRHHKFGVGTMLSVQGHGHQTRAKVQFNRFGVKTLILEFASLEKM